MGKKTENENKFATSAKEATSLSEIMKNKTKIDVDELYGEEITITGFDFLSTTDERTKETKEFAVCTYKEDPEAFFFAGTILTKICKRWMSDFGFNTPEECSEALEADGGCVIVMSKGKTKNGNKITNVDIIG